MAKGINAKGLDALQGKRQTAVKRYWDGDGTGFGVKVSAAGSMRWPRTLVERIGFRTWSAV